MPNCPTVPDKQKITFSVSVIEKCMSAAWCRSLLCHSSLWPVICDSRAIETTFKRKATARQSSLTSHQTRGKMHLIKGKREKREWKGAWGWKEDFIWKSRGWWEAVSDEYKALDQGPGEGSFYEFDKWIWVKKRQKIDDEKVFILILPIPMPVCGYLPSIQ